MTSRNDEHDFRQFTGRFDQAMAPSPSFAASLRSMVFGAPVSTRPTSPIMPPAPSAVTAAATLNPPADDVWRAPRWMRTIETAIAAVIVISIVGVSAYFRQPEALFEFASQPTPEAAQNVGDPGRTWVVGNVVPEMGGFRIDPSIPMFTGMFGSPEAEGVIVEDSYVYASADDTSDALVRYDLNTHERLWSTPLFMTGKLASDGELIFGMHSSRNAETDSATLTAVDLESGEITWEGPELANRFIASSSLVVSGDRIFATDYLGNTVAVDKSDGSRLWQFPQSFAAPPEDEDSISGPSRYAAPQLAANDEAVFLSRPSKAIFKLDRVSGAELGSINLVDEYGADIFMSMIQVRDNRLVVTALHAERVSGENDIRGYTPTTVLIFDASSLELQARTELMDFRGNAVITADAIYLPTTMEEDGEARLHRLDPDSGALSDPIDGVVATWDIWLSASGDVLMATGDPSTIAFFDLGTGEPIGQVKLGITNVETPFQGPVHLWGNNPIVITGLGEVYVVTDDPASP